MQGSRRWGGYIVMWMVAAIGAACGTRRDPDDSDVSAPGAGRLELSLVTEQAEPLRLRQAAFEIARRGGDLELVLDSESDPDAAALRAELAQGSYEITLRDGWRLERLPQEDGGLAEPVFSALLTTNPLSFEVLDARLTELAYDFTTESGTVRFGRGAVSVSIDVRSTVPSGSCSVLDRYSCPPGQTCLLAGDGAQSFCAEPGSLLLGAACDSDQCVAGAQCLSLDPTRPEERRCARFCSPDSDRCNCQSLAIDRTIGVCTDGLAEGPIAVCGNGVIEGPPVYEGRAEQCDGLAMPPGTPVGSQCTATCLLTVPGGSRCLDCARTNCAPQYDAALGSGSSAQNFAEVAQLYACVVGPYWEQGGPIPLTSCFFSDPTQPLGSLVPCYCGSTPTSTCLATGPRNSQEACGLEIEIASHCNPPLASCVTASGSNPEVPLSDALQLLNCERAACNTACGFPHGDE